MDDSALIDCGVPQRHEQLLHSGDGSIARRFEHHAVEGSVS